MCYIVAAVAQQVTNSVDCLQALTPTFDCTCIECGPHIIASPQHSEYLFFWQLCMLGASMPYMACLL